MSDRDTLHRIIEDNADAIVIVEDDGVMRFANRAASRLFGRDVTQLIGHPFGYPVVVDEAAELDIARDGQERTVAEMRVVDIDWEGRPAYLATLRDITENKRLDRMLQDKEEVLRRAQKLEVLGRLGAEVAHEINNLLMSVTACAKVARKRIDKGEDARAIVDEIERTTNRGIGIVRQLLGFSRRNAAKPGLIDVNDVIRGLNLMIQRAVGVNIDVALDLAPALGPVKADVGRIEQVVMNLVVNARDAMPGGGCLDVETREQSVGPDEARAAGRGVKPGPYVTITVRDTGTGMDADVQARLFEPFFTTKAEDMGTGLGLSTTAAIVKDYDGHIAWDSAVGRGTEFRILLPREEGSAVGLDAVTSLASAQAPVSVHGTILIVDDNRVTRMALIELLEEEGFRVIGAADGEEAIAYLRDRDVDIDLLLSDIALPGLSGYEIVAEAEALRPGLPVIYMSGHVSTPEVSESGYQYLLKPVDFDVLMATIRTQLDRRTGVTSAV